MHRDMYIHTYAHTYKEREKKSEREKYIDIYKKTHEPWAGCGQPRCT